MKSLFYGYGIIILISLEIGLAKVIGQQSEEYFILKNFDLEVHFYSIKNNDIIYKELPLMYYRPNEPVYAYYNLFDNYIIIPRFGLPGGNRNGEKYNLPQQELFDFHETAHYSCERLRGGNKEELRIGMVLDKNYGKEFTEIISLYYDYDCRIYEFETPMIRLLLRYYVNEYYYAIEISKPAGTNTIEDEIKWAKSFLNKCVDIGRSY